MTWQPPKRGPIGDPPPSWREGATKQAILDFVQRVTAEGGADAGPAQERVAVFDNDRMLWSESRADPLRPLRSSLSRAITRNRCAWSRSGGDVAAVGSQGPDDEDVEGDDGQRPERVVGDE